MIRWEYQGIQRNSANLSKLVSDLNRLGRDGWEVIGFASADKTLGLNSIMAILKRPVEAPAVAEAAGTVEIRPATVSDRPEGSDLTASGFQVWEAMAGEQRPLSFDEIAEHTSLALVDVSIAIEELEEIGFAVRQRGGFYTATVRDPG